MSMNGQTDFAHLVFLMQNGQSLTIGPLAELNYEMASDVWIIIDMFCWLKMLLKVKRNQFISVNETDLSMFDAYGGVCRLNHFHLASCVLRVNSFERFFLD